MLREKWVETLHRNESSDERARNDYRAHIVFIRLRYSSAYVGGSLKRDSRSFLWRNFTTKPRYRTPSSSVIVRYVDDNQKSTTFKSYQSTAHANQNRTFTPSFLESREICGRSTHVDIKDGLPKPNSIRRSMQTKRML